MIQIATIAGLLTMALTTGATDIEFYVAPEGHDDNPGTLDRPFGSIMAARNTIRTLRGPSSPESPIHVWIRGGVYYLDETVQFTSADSGRENAPIVYAAYKNESPIISGGARLNLDWSAYRDGFFRAEVPEGVPDFEQLYVNGKRQHLARYPNHNPSLRHYGGTAADAIDPSRASRWKNPIGGYIHALHRSDWGGFHYRITGVKNDGSLELEGGYQNNRQHGMHDEHRFVENVFEELDCVGEWFYDRQERTLYYMPAADTNLKSAIVEVSGLKHLFEFTGTQNQPIRNVELRGLTLRHTERTFMQTKEPLLRSDWTIYRGGAIRLEGAEDCRIADCVLEDLGGNGVFVSNYNRGVTIEGCRISGVGASGVCFVGDPKAVRSPSFEYGEFIPLEEIDRTPGPKGENFPAECTVHDNLIHTIGVVEKQVAGVQISMAMSITVSQNSIYDTPRAGINISEGTWGGHLIEGNDVFDTVRETGDHGSFNSWGRDRFWHPNREVMNRITKENPEMVSLDAIKTTIIRNNRWRCDRGWDIDLDDGSSNYHIYNNLCLRGGIKLREGFNRTVENNITVNNSYHPHVSFENSGDVFRRNIVDTWYRPIRVPAWGDEVDFNLLPTMADLTKSNELGLDKHSLAGDPQFVDEVVGDFRVLEDSPALKIGFKNFEMDFGVRKPALRAQARTPLIPRRLHTLREGQAAETYTWLGAMVQDLRGLGQRSAVGAEREAGVLVLAIPSGSAAEEAGLVESDLILECGNKAVNTFSELKRHYEAASGAARVPLVVLRFQQRKELEIQSGLGN